MVEVLTENHPRMKLITSPQAGNCVLLVCVVNDICFNNETSWVVLGLDLCSVLFIKLQMLKVLMLLCLRIKVSKLKMLEEHQKSAISFTNKCTDYEEAVSIKCDSKLQIEVLQLWLNLC
jgi:hypothetical protein